tara:strand:- start:234 stop:455 length:222 start_codon:yes stop_codon:yes gene_type:complete
MKGAARWPGLSPYPQAESEALFEALCGLWDLGLSPEEQDAAEGEAWERFAQSTGWTRDRVEEHLGSIIDARRG